MLSFSHIFTFGFACLALVCATACGEGSGSSVGKFTRDANFPLYFSISGTRLGDGSVYKIAALERGALATPELVVSGLDFPTGIAMDGAGRLYIAEKLPEPDGKVKVVEPGATTATVLVTGLHNPVAVAVDSFDRLYVTANDLDRILKTDAAGDVVPFVDTGLSSPRDLYVDPHDNVYVSEVGEGVVAKISPKGERTVVASGLANPFGLTADLAGDLYVVVNRTGGNDGELVHIPAAGGTPKTLASGLANPVAVAFDNAHGLFFIEGGPANRIVNYSLKSGELTVVGETPANPYAIMLTPF